MPSGMSNYSQKCGEGGSFWHRGERVSCGLVGGWAGAQTGAAIGVVFGNILWWCWSCTTCNNRWCNWRYGWRKCSRLLL